MPKISNPSSDLGVLNRELRKISTLRRQNSQLQNLVNQAQNSSELAQNQAQLDAANNISATWDSTNHKFTWTAGYVVDRAGKHLPIPAGQSSIADGVALAASKTYWFAWNPDHQIMMLTQQINKALGYPNNLILFSITTPASGGTTGGGGSDSGGFGRLKQY